ncbi:hypothetical protein KIW84_023928 [Lathyrus oleraceus]|uniref:Retrovirus-related Pol polyprotein from transposon TNT 1-94-like beta-barrel domain-containing protein n=1 Tax=Pisum sativum TaxID=3888 RepID=A0A9D4YE75_PEA|nr:hypothetical protein KIW84_023928 [Pisum sativum]
MIVQLENEKAEHVETISKLKTEVVFLNSKLEEMTNPVHHKTHHQPRPKHHRPVNKKQWVPKTNVTSLIAHTSFRVSVKEDWYFDNGCSRHMTGNKDLLTGLHPHATSYVTFGDGAKGEISLEFLILTRSYL